MKRVADEFRAEDAGTLAIATTHTPKRGTCCRKCLTAFAAKFPKVRLVLHQGNPIQVAEQTQAGEADRRHRDRIASPIIPSSVTLAVLSLESLRARAAKGTRLTKVRPLTLEALAQHPIVTYDFAFTGRFAINAAFTAKGLEPNVVLTALDADVIKTYRRARHGGRNRRPDGIRPARRIVRSTCSTPAIFLRAPRPRLALRRGVFLRGYAYQFITLFAPQYVARGRRCSAQRQRCSRSAMTVALRRPGPGDRELKSQGLRRRFCAATRISAADTCRPLRTSHR